MRPTPSATQEQMEKLEDTMIVGTCDAKVTRACRRLCKGAWRGDVDVHAAPHSFAHLAALTLCGMCELAQ
jgi:hypothetical protein